MLTTIEDDGDNHDGHGETGGEPPIASGGSGSGYPPGDDAPESPAFVEAVTQLANALNSVIDSRIDGLHAVWQLTDIEPAARPDDWDVTVCRAATQATTVATLSLARSIIDDIWTLPSAPNIATATASVRRINHALVEALKMATFQALRLRVSQDLTTILEGTATLRETFFGAQVAALHHIRADVSAALLGNLERHRFLERDDPGAGTTALVTLRTLLVAQAAHSSARRAQEQSTLIQWCCLLAQLSLGHIEYDGGSVRWNRTNLVRLEVHKDIRVEAMRPAPGVLWLDVEWGDRVVIHRATIRGISPRLFPQLGEVALRHLEIPMVLRGRRGTADGYEQCELRVARDETGEAAAAFDPQNTHASYYLQAAARKLFPRTVHATPPLPRRLSRQQVQDAVEFLFNRDLANERLDGKLVSDQGSS